MHQVRPSTGDTWKVVFIADTAPIERVLKEGFASYAAASAWAQQVIVLIACENPECSNYSTVINWITCDDESEAELFLEAFGHGGEDVETDYCPVCKALGVAQ